MGTKRLKADADADRFQGNGTGVEGLEPVPRDRNRFLGAVPREENPLSKGPRDRFQGNGADRNRFQGNGTAGARSRNRFLGAVPREQNPLSKGPRERNWFRGTRFQGMRTEPRHVRSERTYARAEPNT